jgi:hypothetical protein
MADRCINPLSTYYRGPGSPWKNGFCDPHPPTLNQILLDIKVIIGQINTYLKHALCGWGLTRYSCLTLSPMSWGLAIYSKTVPNSANKPLPGHSVCMGYSMVVCCGQGLYKLIPHPPPYTPMQHISYLKTSSLYIQ